MGYKIEVMDYRTNEVVRAGTEEELAESVAVADRDGGCGVIQVADFPGPVYVIGSQLVNF